jgi:ABC-2 type transport system permease protein
MNVIYISVKEIIQILRDKRAMIMMVLFPMLLMTILGSALSGAFEGSSINLNTKIIYTIKGEGELSKAFASYMDGIKDMGIEFQSAKSEEEGLSSIKDATYSCYIKLDANSNKLELYKNERYDFSANLIEGTLKFFVDKYNVIYEISKVNPSKINELTKNKHLDYVESLSLEKNSEPRAKDFYAITMMTLIIMYSSLTGAYSIIGEKTRKTKDRIFISPTKKYEFFMGKLTGTVIVTMLQMIVLILFSKFVLRANLGENMLIVLAMVLVQITMAISIGIGIAMLIDNEATVTSLLNTIIPFTVFLGGGYIPLDQFGSSILNNLSKLSPLKWTNEALFKVIYASDYSLVNHAVIINLCVAFIFIVLASAKLRKSQA